MKLDCGPHAGLAGSRHRLPWILATLIAAVLALGAAAARAQPLDIDEWLVPWPDTRPRDPYLGPQGRVWFCGQVGNYLAYLEPGSGRFQRFNLGPGTHPHNLIVAPGGEVWYAGNQDAHIGRFDPLERKILKVAMPHTRAGDPHTLAFTASGDIWFTVQWGNFIGRLYTDTARVRLLEVPTPRARPYGIKVDRRQRPWVVLLGTNKLATVDPDRLTLSEIEIPHPRARPRRLEVDAAGNVWFVDYARGYLGRYDPGSGGFEEWLLPGGENSRPYGTALDRDGRIWIAETGAVPNHLVGFDPRTRTFLSRTPVPNGGGSIRHMYYDPARHEVWYGADTNHIGRVRLPD